MLKRRLRISEACALEGIGKTTLYDRLARGEYDAVQEGRSRRITEESIERRRHSIEGRSAPRPEMQRPRTSGRFSKPEAAA